MRIKVEWTSHKENDWEPLEVFQHYGGRIVDQECKQVGRRWVHRLTFDVKEFTVKKEEPRVVYRSVPANLPSEIWMVTNHNRPMVACVHEVDAQDTVTALRNEQYVIYRNAGWSSIPFNLQPLAAVEYLEKERGK